MLATKKFTGRDPRAIVVRVTEPENPNTKTFYKSKLNKKVKRLKY